MPSTLRKLAHINMCPMDLQRLLMAQPAVATGTLSFTELESLIMMCSAFNHFSALHSSTRSKSHKALNNFHSLQLHAVNAADM